MAKIAVIVPVYRVEKYLARCVESVLAQTFTNFELILVDDGSPDNCPAMCDEYAKKDPRVHVIHKPNGGVSTARNAALNYCFAKGQCEYVMFLDSDDWIHGKMLEAMLDANLRNGTDMCVCANKIVRDPESVVPASDFSSTVYDTAKFFIDKTLESVIVVAKLNPLKDFENVRFPVGTHVGEDELTAPKILFKYEKVSFVPAVMYYYFENPTSVTHSKWSPIRLGSLDALEYQMTMFRGMKNEELIRYQKLRILQMIERNVSAMGDDYPEIKKQLVRKYKRLLILWGRAAGYTVKNDWWIYEPYFPVTMKILHGYYQIVNSLSKGGVSGTWRKIRKVLCRKSQ